MYEQAKMIGELNECLFRLRRPLINFLKEVLPPVLKSDSWETIIMDGLKNNKQASEILKSEDITKFVDLDMSLLFIVLWDNWENFKQFYNSLTTDTYYKYYGKFDNQSLARQIQKIRNAIAHPNDNTVSTSTMKTILEDLVSFANFINADEEIILQLDRIKSKYIKFQNDKEFESEKKKRIEFIEDTVLGPALNNFNLSDDIKDSILTTLYRFKLKQSIEEIDDFFLGALKSKRGQKIRGELNKLGLRAFEDIQDTYISNFVNHK
jgi:hypothetical protein